MSDSSSTGTRIALSSLISFPPDGVSKNGSAMSGSSVIVVGSVKSFGSTGSTGVGSIRALSTHP